MCTSMLLIFGPNLTDTFFVKVIKRLKYSLVVTHVRSNQTNFREKIAHRKEAESFQIMLFTVSSHFTLECKQDLLKLETNDTWSMGFENLSIRHVFYASSQK